MLKADQTDETSLKDYLNSLDFESGQPVTERPHHQGEVRLFAPKHPKLPSRLIIKRPLGQGLRGWLARYALRREYHAYQRLSSIEGFAPCFGFFFERYLVLGYVEGKALQPNQRLSQESTDGLRLSILQMHEAGVAHGDLKRHDNLLVAPNGKIFILDLGTTWLKRAGFHPINHCLFAFFARTDLNAWIKHKYLGYENVTAADQPFLKRSWIERALTYWRSRRRSNP